MSLTDEDKDWITEQLRVHFGAERDWITEQIRVRLGAERDWITEQIRTVETSLLTEFHKWASPSEARLRTHAAALRAIDLEMESLTERVAKLEGK
jgi:hypothetical protein